MPVSVDVIQDHIAYTGWATRRLVEAAAQLSSEELTHDFGTADRSVLGTLLHIFDSDRIWLERLEAAPSPTLLTDSERNIAFLQNAIPALHQRWVQWAAQLTPESLAADLAYRDTKGNPWNQSVWKLLLHIVNHATHHRGQVSGFLRSLGHTPPILDLTAYYRQQ